MSTHPHLVVVGSGGRAYRQYAYASLVLGYRVSAVLPVEPTWQRPYLTGFAAADTTDPKAIARAVSALATGDSDVGIVTWDETVLEATALAAEELGLPHMSARAAANCRDKYATRSLLGGHGVSAVRHRLVTSEAEALLAAEELGYPVVLKPRALAGSIGVVKADDSAAVRQAFATAEASRFADLPTGHGVLVEEYLDGPEISVDSVAFGGTVHCVHVARKRLGFPPYFEEVGHLVTDWVHEPWAEEVRDLVVRAHEALEVTHGVTHAEVRLTGDGPRLVELNGRLGGDLIPYASTLATGVDLVTAAAELAFGRMPSLHPTRHDTAEVRFVYPPFDCVVRDVDVCEAAALPGIDHAVALAEPGTRLMLPPKAAIPRLAAVVSVGADEQECGAALDKAEHAVGYEIRAV